MRIAVFAGSFPPQLGGIATFSEVLADWLATAGHDVVLATPVPAEPGSDRDRPYRVVRRPGLGRMIGLARAAEVVHVKSLSTRAVLASLAGGRAPIVTHGHHQAICPNQIAWSSRGACTAGPRPGPCGPCERRSLADRVHVRRQRWAAGAARRNVAVSDYLSVRLGLPRSVTIYNPVEPALFAGADRSGEEADLIAFAGRLSAPKGLDVLLRALARMPYGRLEVAGDGPARAEWERLADQEGVSARVRFRGVVDGRAVAELYSRSAVVCVPSLWPEPFGYAAAEAMALGCAVVATAEGALPELLAAGRGYLVEGADPVGLAAALSRALADPDERHAVGAAAGAFARQRLHPDVIGTRYLEEYTA